MTPQVILLFLCVSCENRYVLNVIDPVLEAFMLKS